jgi:alkanesulfonate monooxygenase SsuD/methylene tetrahydromethanopterin reductase-like flavin-dependent oxidoreductase (luciferase family)
MIEREGSMAASRRGFGLAAAVEPEVIRGAAQLAEELGYHSFWLNDNDQGDGLEGLAQAAAVTSRIMLGVGVIALSRKPAEQIVEHLRQLDGSQGGDVRLPLDRLWLGVGSGAGGKGALERVRDGLETLNREANTTVFISALGPRMSRLAGESAAGVLFNWLTPEFSETANGWVREGAKRAGRPVPVLASYVRASLGPDGARRMASEAARYNGVPSYGAHFQRMGIEPVAVGIRGETADDIRQALAHWEGRLDEIVVRSITAHDTLEETLALVRAGAPGH